MPGTPNPVGEGPGRVPVIWNAITQKLQALTQRVSALEGARQPNILDGFGNTIIVVGQLLQTVTIGATNTSGTAVPGVQVQTVLHSPPAGQPLVGIAVQQSLATGTITTTKGSTAATLVSTTSGTFTSGQVIGAATVNDPSTGVATPAIVPGTTFTITGSAITLSQPAAESGTGLYAAAAFWHSLAGLTYP